MSVDPTSSMVLMGGILAGWFRRGTGSSRISIEIGRLVNGQSFEKCLVSKNVPRSVFAADQKW
jgi:hypothetical protein